MEGNNSELHTYASRLKQKLVSQHVHSKVLYVFKEFLKPFLMVMNLFFYYILLQTINTCLYLGLYQWFNVIQCETLVKRQMVIKNLKKEL